MVENDCTAKILAEAGVLRGQNAGGPSNQRLHQNKKAGCKALCLFVLVEARGVEPLSENPSIQLSPGALCRLEFPAVSAGTQALTLGSHFMRDPFNGERRMHVHR